MENGLDGKGTIRFDGPDTLNFDIAPDFNEKMVFAVMKQDGAQSSRHHHLVAI